VWVIIASAAEVPTPAAQQLVANINSDTQFKADGGRATGAYDVSAGATLGLGLLWVCFVVFLVAF
jgi:hypothetical protein